MNRMVWIILAEEWRGVHWKWLTSQGGEWNRQVRFITFYFTVPFLIFASPTFSFYLFLYLLFVILLAWPLFLLSISIFYSNAALLSYSDDNSHIASFLLILPPAGWLSGFAFCPFIWVYWLSCCLFLTCIYLSYQLTTFICPCLLSLLSK